MSTVRENRSKVLNSGNTLKNYLPDAHFKIWQRHPIRNKWVLTGNDVSFSTSILDPTVSHGPQTDHFLKTTVHVQWYLSFIPGFRFFTRVGSTQLSGVGFSRGSWVRSCPKRYWKSQGRWVRRLSIVLLHRNVVVQSYLINWSQKKKKKIYFWWIGIYDLAFRGFELATCKSWVWTSTSWAIRDTKFIYFKNSFEYYIFHIWIDIN